MQYIKTKNLTQKKQVLCGLRGIFLLFSCQTPEYGYILDNEAMQILKMDKMFNGKFWKKQLERIAKKVQS